MTDISKVCIDKAATKNKILSIAQSKGISVQDFNKAVEESSTRYREASGKTELIDIEEYVIIAQVLGVRLDDLFTITQD